MLQVEPVVAIENIRRQAEGTRSAIHGRGYDEGWLCVVPPGNIGCHGDDKGFTTICSVRASFHIDLR
jgi:hypothetical protein